MTHFGIDIDPRIDAAGRLDRIAGDAEAAEGGRLRRHHPGRAARAGHAASIGIINVARLARVPIQPITYATTRRRLLSTWDRYHLALPFGRGVFLWGEPIEIDPDLDEAGMERARRFVEERMLAMVREADCRVGHPPPSEWTAGTGLCREKV